MVANEEAEEGVREIGEAGMVVSTLLGAAEEVGGLKLERQDILLAWWWWLLASGGLW